MFSGFDYLLIGLIFLWAGFVRSGLGFGGAALGLPLLLLIGGSPVYWLPLIGIHLLFFTSITLLVPPGSVYRSWNNVDWDYLKSALVWITLPTLIGVFGLLTLADQTMIILVYLITAFYAIIWIFNKPITVHKPWLNKLLLLLGGYVAGTTLTGAPLIVAVFIEHVDKTRLRDTLFILWFVLVSIKMTAFIAVGIEIDWVFSLSLIPVALVGHIVGLRLHNTIIQNDQLFKKWVGSVLLIVCGIGLLKTIL